MNLGSHPIRGVDVGFSSGVKIGLLEKSLIIHQGWCIITQITRHGLKSTFDQQFTNDDIQLKHTGCVEFDTLEYYYFIVPIFSSLVINDLY